MIRSEDLVVLKYVNAFVYFSLWPSLLRKYKLCLKWTIGTVFIF